MKTIGEVLASTYSKEKDFSAKKQFLITFAKNCLPLARPDLVQHSILRRSILRYYLH